MTNCPYCNSEEIPDAQPSASQRFSTYRFTCGTEIVYCGDAESVEWCCLAGERPEVAVVVPSEASREAFRKYMKEHFK